MNNPLKMMTGWQAAKGIGKNLFNLNRSVEIGDDLNNRSVRAFDESKMYIGMSANNYFKSSYITSYSYNDSNNSFTLLANQNGYGVGFPIRCKPNTTYTISANISKDDINGPFMCGFFTDSGSHISYDVNADYTITTPNNCYWLLVCVRPMPADGEVTYSDIQVEEGDTATEYEYYGKLEALKFHNCKGGYFSTKDEYGLQVFGRTGSSHSKNLLPLPTNFENGITKNGLTVSFDKETQIYTLNGQASIKTNIGFDFPTPLTLDNTEKYYLSLTYISGNVSTENNYNVFYINGDEANWITAVLRNSNSVSVWHDKYVSTVSRLWIYIGKPETAIFTNYRFKIQLEKYDSNISIPSEWEPYDIHCVKQGTKIQNFINYFDYKAEPYVTYENKFTVGCSADNNVIRVRADDIIKYPYQYAWYVLPDALIGKTLEISYKGRINASSLAMASLRFMWGDSNKIPSYNICTDTPIRNTEFKAVKYDVTIPKNKPNGAGDLVLVLYLFQGSYVEGAYSEYKDLTITDVDTDKCYILTPCNLYDGDVYFPMTGKVIRRDNTIEQYDPQPIFAPSGTVNVTQEPVDLPAALSATMLVKRSN